MVNALVGEPIAPTDATEATRIVTWFSHGPTPGVTAVHYGGSRSNVPITRDAGGALSFDFGEINPDDVADLEVRWPAAELIDVTIIDTPGTSSLSRDVSARTLRLLVPGDGVPRVDAVVFLLRTRNAADIGLLKQIGELVGGSAGALGVIGRRRAPTRSGPGASTRCCRRRTSRPGSPPRWTRPVSVRRWCPSRACWRSPHARCARTSSWRWSWRRSTPAELEQGDAQRGSVCCSYDTLPVDPATRARLLDRFGMFGIRMAVAALRAGPTDAARVSWPTNCSSAAGWWRCAT